MMSRPIIGATFGTSGLRSRDGAGTTVTPAPLVVHRLRLPVQSRGGSRVSQLGYPSSSASVAGTGLTALDEVYA